MTDFSASDAALEGFQVLRKDWRVVIGWCLFSVLAFVALLVVAFIAILVSTLAVVSKDQATTLGGVVGGLVLGLGGVMVEIAVTLALYRLMLRPGMTPNIFYLRIGRDELRLLGLWLLLLTVLSGLLVAGFMAVRWLGQINGLVAAAGALAVLALILWLAMRSSLAGPANFDQGGLGLRPSWRMTRGHFWPLLGAATLATCLSALIAGVLWIVTAVLQAAIGGFHTFAAVDLSDAQALAERPGAYVFGVVAELIVGPVFWLISQAPFASVYRTLKAREVA